ncbi:TatD family hydrolase [Collinsella sp. AGMB00827]|uniref:TatD family hydrolase n=1 Tax=Collinsella ureilytica TaxID=2869515 RepID=A0ABS7MKL5_9ACTN|nr:TatD family hydrolase [Collinsella urealyticum]MBY4797907.1 TatD family hydrolase [Collinsella urealyticum]
MTYRFYDMHCHIDHIADAESVLSHAHELGCAFLCTPVTPRESKLAEERFAAHPNVQVAYGLHPWWISGDDDQAVVIAEAVRDVRHARFIGEIGLDFSKAHLPMRGAQVEAFGWMLQALAEHQHAGRVLSLHAVKSAGLVLDMLERFDLTSSATCIFHWFSGTSDELGRARALGCSFSVSERMLATKRGREYARIIPEECLLLETDAPPTFDTSYPAEKMLASLEAIIEQLATIRGTNRHSLAARIAERSSELLGI